jgi:hypothetical protein
LPWRASPPRRAARLDRNGRRYADSRRPRCHSLYRRRARSKRHRAAAQPRSRAQSRHREILHVGWKRYWSTNGPLRNERWVSVSGDDKVVVIDYADALRVATVQVGDHPQRVREGVVDADVLATWSSAA